jgi:hypothetical protein
MVDTLRYWDGEHWSDHTAPAPQAPTQAALVSTWKIASGVALGMVAVIAGLVFLGSVVSADDDLDCARDNADRAMNGQPLRDCG